MQLLFIPVGFKRIQSTFLCNTFYNTLRNSVTVSILKGLFMQKKRMIKHLIVYVHRNLGWTHSVSTRILSMVERNWGLQRVLTINVVLYKQSGNVFLPNTSLTCCNKLLILWHMETKDTAQDNNWLLISCFTKSTVL